MDITRIDFNPVLAKAKMSEEGFADLLRIIEPYVMYKAQSLLSSQSDAQDVFQIVSLGIYRNFSNINPDAFMSYLKTAVTNTCRDFLRKRYRTTDEGDEIRFVELDAFQDWDIPAEDDRIDLMGEYRSQIVSEVIQSLPESQREVIVMRYMDDMKIRDIALQLNENENTIKSRLYLAFRKIEEKILEIQERDGIRLYSYSPVMFFLLLFIRGYRSQIPDSLLVKNTMDSVNRLARSAKAMNDAKTVNTLAHSAANDVIKTAASATVKTGLSTAAKAAIAVLTTFTVTYAGLFGYKAVQNSRTQKLLDRYQNDIVEISYDLEDTVLEVGETRDIKVSYSSSENLEYDIRISASGGFVNIDGSIIEAVRSGKGNVIVTLLCPHDETEKERASTYVIVHEKQNLANSLGIRMMTAGNYHTQHIFVQDNPAFYGGSYIQFSDFSWDDFDTKYSDWAKQDLYEGKAGDYVGSKGSKGDMYGLYSFKYFDSDGNPEYINLNGPFLNNCGYRFSFNGDTIYAESTYYGMQDITFSYDEASGQYYTENANGRIYFDMGHPYFAGQAAYNDRYTMVYDDEYHLIEVLTEYEYYTRRIVFDYEDDLVVAAHEYNNDDPQTESVFYYNDEGLLTGIVGYNVSSSSMVPYGAVTSIYSYDYSY